MLRVFVMKTVYISILYYIEALIFDSGTRLVMKLNYSSYMAVLLSRFLERLGERLRCNEDIIKSRLKL
ncbi:MAG: hypothetical protein IJ300_08340 [Clostridia bacterium]|nr:hypothetical protein [Clostridia bacterium]